MNVLLGWIVAMAQAIGSASADVERLVTPVPPDWELVQRVHTGDTRALDYEPAKAAPRVDDERLSIESSRFEQMPEPSEFLTLLAEARRRDCPTLFAREITRQTENGYPSALWLYLCPGARAGQPRMQMTKAIRGEDWFYVIGRRSLKANVAADSADNERVRVADWSSAMRGYRVCHLLRPDRPCTSPPAR